MPKTDYKQVFLGIGSNLGDKKQNVLSSIKRIDAFEGTRVIAYSGLYKTPPHGIITPNWFINAACEIITSITPRALLRHCLELERSFGRNRQNGMDRELDVDILYYNNCIVWEHDLKLPHPRLSMRGFVLVPWCEIAPDLVLRPWGVSVKRLLRYCDKQDIVRLHNK